MQQQAIVPPVEGLTILKNEESRNNDTSAQDATTNKIEPKKRSSNARVVLSKSPINDAEGSFEKGRKSVNKELSARKEGKSDGLSTIDDFVLMEKLGDGAYSKVYKV